MKKFALVCAVVLAGVFTSCGDTNYCYEISYKYNVLGQEVSATSYVWGTSNDLDAAIAEVEATLAGIGIADDAYEVKYKRLSKSESECK